MELARTTNTGVNISSELAILSYTYASVNPIEVIARVDLGSGVHPVVGGGNYVLNFYINNVPVTPISSIAVPSADTKTIIVSRQIPIYQNDIVVIKVVGLIGDTNVDTLSTLRTATPAQISDLLGAGLVAIDHNYGGTNALAYEDHAHGDVGIVGADVMAYLKTDYDAGHTGPVYVLGKTKTVIGGAWATPIYLNPGAYKLTFVLPGKFGPDTVSLTVS